MKQKDFFFWKKSFYSKTEEENEFFIYLKSWILKRIEKDTKILQKETNFGTDLGVYIFYMYENKKTKNIIHTCVLEIEWQNFIIFRPKKTKTKTKWRTQQPKKSNKQKTQPNKENVSPKHDRTSEAKELIWFNKCHILC